MGSAASASIKQQAKALKGRRYMRGMRPEKYFEVVVKAEHGELFTILGFSEEEAFEIFVQVRGNWDLQQIGKMLLWITENGVALLDLLAAVALLVEQLLL